MAVEVQHYKVDDLAAAKDPQTEVRADQTVQFGLGPDMWEIDLTEENADKLQKKFAPYIAAGRPVRGKRRSRASSPAGRRDPSAIRKWARARGIEVSDRGRIPVLVIQQYEAAVTP